MQDRGAVVIAGPPGAERARVEKTLRGIGLLPVDHHSTPALLVVLEDAPHADWPGVPVIVVSSRTDIDSFTDAITSRAAAYLTRPVDTRELAVAARRLAQWRAAPATGNTRGWQRRPLLLEVDLEIDGHRLRGRLVDVSATGCRVETAGALKRGDKVRLTPRALGTSTGIALAGTVTRARAADDAGSAVCVAALRFNSTSALLAGRIFGAPGVDRRQALRSRR